MQRVVREVRDELVSQAQRGQDVSRTQLQAVQDPPARTHAELQRSVGPPVRAGAAQDRLLGVEHLAHLAVGADPVQVPLRRGGARGERRPAGRVVAPAAGVTVAAADREVHPLVALRQRRVEGAFLPVRHHDGRDEEDVVQLDDAITGPPGQGSANELEIGGPRDQPVTQQPVVGDDPALGGGQARRVGLLPRGGRDAAQQGMPGRLAHRVTAGLAGVGGRHPGALPAAPVQRGDRSAALLTSPVRERVEERVGCAVVALAEPAEHGRHRGAQQEEVQRCPGAGRVEHDGAEHLGAEHTVDVGCRLACDQSCPGQSSRVDDAVDRAMLPAQTRHLGVGLLGVGHVGLADLDPRPAVDERAQSHDPNAGRVLARVAGEPVVPDVRGREG